MMLHDLEYVFGDNITVRTDRGIITLSRVNIGKIIVTSGYIVACDPSWADENTIKAFLKTIPPGQYPVILSIEHSSRRYQSGYKDYQSVAFATLRLQTQLPVRWEVALLRDADITELEEDDIHGYSVDSGTGCLMDEEAAKFFVQRLQSDPGYLAVLDHEIGKHYIDTWSWAALTWEPEISANLIAFSSGDGDGGYSSYFGFDADDKVVCLTTDFGLLSGADHQ